MSGYSTGKSIIENYQKKMLQNDR